MPHTNFYETSCPQEPIIQFVETKITNGDTIHSLFLQVASPEQFPFIERLASFYELNPHLQNQPLRAGNFVKIPIKKLSKC